MKNEKAFPCEEWIDSDDPYLINPIRHTGMDLRDYFAAKALMSMLSPVQEIKETTPEKAARWSYKFADAMMEARK